jgi:hypothetical protein
MQSDSLFFLHCALQRRANACQTECKKALKILTFLAQRRACLFALLRIMKNYSIIRCNQSGILGRLNTPAQAIIRMRSNADRSRPAPSAPHSTSKQDDGFFHKYQDMVMSLDQSRVIHAV